MSGSPFEQALAHYSAQLVVLAQPDAPLTREAVLAILGARDAVQAALQERPQLSAATMLRLTECDGYLRDHAARIAQAGDLPAWRASFRPPQDAWWWFVTAPPQPQRWDHFDWLWNLGSAVCLTVALSLVVDISGRFLSDGPDTLGAFAVIGQSVLTLLAAGGAFTQMGRDAIERILTSIGLGKSYWAEAQFAFAFVLSAGLIFLYYALPSIASTYNNLGVEHYRAGRLASAEMAYKRALKLNPDSVSAHYNLGRLSEALDDFDRAQASYQAALKGGLDAAYNNLARLYILREKSAQAEALLLDGLDRTQDDEVRYSMLKNLGWARWALKDYVGAEDALRQAIAVQQHKAPAYCVLAKVLAAQQEAEPQGQAAVQEQEVWAWVQCLRWCSRRHSPEESRWCIEARHKLARGGEKL